MFQQLKSRLDKIERRLATIAIAKQEVNCNCRGPGKRIVETRVHSAEEFERIAAVPCPVHGVRDLGFTCYASKWVPINRADWEFCDCPPDLMRDMNMGRIPLPDDPEERRQRIEELKQEDRNRKCREAMTGIQSLPRRDFKEWKAKTEDVLRKHTEQMALQGRFNGS